MSGFKSTHNLDFEVAPWITEDFQRFRIGTVSGIWAATSLSYDILGIDNDKPGNGHFEDTLQWFENSCKRDNRALRILEVWNERLKKHLISKRGFVEVPGTFHVIKYFKNEKK